MANRALDSLQQSLIKILHREQDDLTTRNVKRQIIRIHDAAVYLQLNLKHFPDEETPREVAHTGEEVIEYVFSPENLSNCGSVVPAVRLSNQLTELAAEVESTAGDVVDYISISSPSDEDRLTLPTGLAARISNRFRRLLEKMKSNVSDEDSSSTELAAVVGDSSSTSALMTQEDDMAGFDRQFVNVSAGVGSSSRSSPTSRQFHPFEEDLVVRILDQLVGHPTKRRVLSIVGMGGIGKSSLAKIVYDYILTKQHFDICAWITLSQDSSFESIVSDLLASLKLKTELVQSDPFHDIYIRLRLYTRRYLIVMDDLWSLQLLDDIRRVIPDNGNRSRIMLTTRLMDLATSSGSSIHTMRLLDEQESWDLFKRQVFADDHSCPSELQPIAKKIVQGCGGLPLSIVKVASLLYNVDKNPKLWQEIVANDGKLGTTSSLSYNHLPDHLRLCFLYMAAFPGDYEIHASELIRLWIAEGFLEGSGKWKCSEERGESYLNDLVEKNLVLVISRKIDGKIHKCKLHSTVRDFCVRQAEHAKFLLTVMDYLPTPILRRHFLPQVVENYRCISASWYDIKDSMQSSCTKTIICIPQKGYRPKVSVRNFASLRVLHVLHREDHFYWEIGQVYDLIHLAYLASNIPTSIVPPAISNLQNLQTLIIYRHEVRLPVEIWRLRQLRHLIAFSFHPLPQPEEDAFPLINLQTLSFATDFVCSARMVEMIPNITKLGICYSESEEILDEGYYCLDNISHLIQLETLKLERRGLIWLSLNPLFPQSLKKLTLSGWRLPWSDMMIVASLDHLQVLKLKNYACDGECWETTVGGFFELKLLLIDESNLQLWISTSSHFPVLQCLMLHRCESLLEIPGDFGDIPTLELIEIDDSNQSLLNSAQRIQEDQQIKWRNDDLQVHAVLL